MGHCASQKSAYAAKPRFQGRRETAARGEAAGVQEALPTHAAGLLVSLLTGNKQAVLTGAGPQLSGAKSLYREIFYTHMNQSEEQARALGDDAGLVSWANHPRSAPSALVGTKRSPVGISALAAAVRAGQTTRAAAAIGAAGRDASIKREMSSLPDRRPRLLHRRCRTSSTANSSTHPQSRPRSDRSMQRIAAGLSAGGRYSPSDGVLLDRMRLALMPEQAGGISAAVCNVCLYVSGLFPCAYCPLLFSFLTLHTLQTYLYLYVLYGNY